MFVAEFRAWHDSYALRMTEGLDVTLTSYYLNSFREGKRTWITKVTVFEGRDAKKAMDDVHNDKRVRILSVVGNQVFYELPELKGFHNVVLDKNIFFVKPVAVSNGAEYWTVASKKKKHLLNLYKKVKKLKFRAKIELLGIREEMPRFLFRPFLSELTELQRSALETAFAKGYYEYPRKASAEKIAGELGIPASTFIEHLRKAEARIMPQVLKL